jgi:hypothetical protein
MRATTAEVEAVKEECRVSWRSQPQPIKKWRTRGPLLEAALVADLGSRGPAFQEIALKASPGKTEAILPVDAAANESPETRVQVLRRPQADLVREASPGRESRLLRDLSLPNEVVAGLDKGNEKISIIKNGLLHKSQSKTSIIIMKKWRFPVILVPYYQHNSSNTKKMT